MKSIGGILFAVMGFLIVSGCSGDDKPAADAVEPALRSYLVLEKARTCGGTVTVDRVSINKIGDFESKLDGYPIYATFGVTCSDGANSSSWISDDTSTSTFTVVVRKKTSGEYECFMPEAFRQRQNALQRQGNSVPDELLKTEVPKPISVPAR